MKRKLGSFFSIITVICVLLMSIGIPNVIAQKLGGTEIFSDDFSSAELKDCWTVINTTEGNTAAIDTTNKNFVLNKALTDNNSNVELTYRLDEPISTGRVEVEMSLKSAGTIGSDIQIQFRGDSHGQKFHTMYRIGSDSKIYVRDTGLSANYAAISNTTLSADTALTFKSSVDYDAAENEKIISYVNGTASSVKRGFIDPQYSNDYESTAIRYVRIYIPKSTAVSGIVIDDFKITHYPSGGNGNFEDFSDNTLDSSWTATGNGQGNDNANIAAVNTSEQNFRLRQGGGAEVGLQYDLDSAVSSGKVAAEFTVRMNAETGNQLQVKFRNTTNDIAAMRLRPKQIPELQLLNASGSVTSNNTVGSDKLEVNNDIRIKVVLDYTAKTATAYVNGADTGTTVALREISNTALNNIYIRVHKDHGPLDASIDDFNVYEVGGVAEAIANTYNNIDLGDTSAVISNLTLPASDTDNGTTISWVSDNESIITSAGVPNGSVGTANLTATISKSGVSATRNFIITTAEPPQQHYFENFNGETKPSGWAGGDLNTANHALSVTKEGVNVAHYTLSSPVTAGSVAVEFDMNKQNSDDKYMQLQLQNSSETDIARISMYGDRVRMVDYVNGNTQHRISDSSKIETGKWINLKFVINFSSDQVSLYVDGRKAKFDISLFDVAAKDLGRIYFVVPSAQTGANYLIDNFKIYTLGGTAEATCLGTDLGFDKTNVTKNITLPGSIDGGTVAWTSSNTSVIANDGTVIRPNDNDAEVILTRTVTKGDVTNTTDFRVVVPANTGSVKYISEDFCDASGAPTLLTPSTAIKGTAKINNDTAEAVSVTIITALYEGDRFVDYKLNTVNVPAGETDVTVATDTITSPASVTNYNAAGVAGEQNYTIKRFLFTSLNELKPLLDADELK